VSTRKPTICDFKPIQVEVAIARVKGASDHDEPVQVLRFANRVPLQFDKASCAIVRAITTVNWRSYGLKQPKYALPRGPYIFAVSVVSPLIMFKNASKETIDASDELVEEIRRALMQAGQRLSRHLSRESKAADLEEKILHLEKFGPVLVDTLVRITKANAKRKESAYVGLKKILGRDTQDAQSKLESAETKLDESIVARKNRLKRFVDEDSVLEALNKPVTEEVDETPTDTLPDTKVESTSKGKPKDSILSVFAPEKPDAKGTKKGSKKAAKFVVEPLPKKIQTKNSKEKIPAAKTMKKLIKSEIPAGKKVTAKKPAAKKPTPKKITSGVCHGHRSPNWKKTPSKGQCRHHPAVP
jgi:DNA topoisomerase-6 subunit B